MVVSVMAAFEAIIVINLILDPGDQSHADNVWIAYVGLVALPILAARSMVLGIWFGDRHLVVRSWFSSRVIEADDLVACTTASWSSWINRGAASSLSVVSLEWNHHGVVMERDMQRTVSSHRQARVACAVIEEFAFDGTRGSACDYARGPLFAEIDARVRAIPKRPGRHS